MTASSSPILLNHYSVLKTSGIDAKKLLQGQVTCNVDEVSALESRLAAHCNAQGRVLSLFYLTEYQSIYYLIMPNTMINLCLTALKKYAVFYKVELSEAPIHVIGFYGGEKPQDRPITTIDAERFFVLDIHKKFAVHAHAEALQHWQYLNIIAGIPMIYPETSGFFLPHEINLIQLNAVSFTKGCYTGQEIIARMEYKGKLKKHLYTAEIQSYATPIPGVDVQYQSGHDILSAGTVVDACQTKLHHFQVLMLLHDEDVQGNDLFIDGDEDAFFQHIKLR